MTRIIRKLDRLLRNLDRVEDKLDDLHDHFMVVMDEVFGPEEEMTVDQAAVVTKQDKKSGEKVYNA